MMSQQQQQQQMQPLQPQPTAFGSNNPFAFSQQQQQPQQQMQPAPQPQMPSSSSVPIADLLGGDSEPPAPAPAPAPQQPASPQGPPRTKVSMDPRHAELNRLLASGEGIDTFGNFGDMRMGHSSARGNLPAQQTGKVLNGQATGSNPFYRG